MQEPKMIEKQLPYLINRLFIVQIKQ
jgi:hypothetical protein